MLRVCLPLFALCACVLAAPTLTLTQLQSQLKSQLASQLQQRANDLDYTPIQTVTDDTRYKTDNLVKLVRDKHTKGNFVFTAGQRITGDKLLVNNYDDESFTTAVDIEVKMSYPSSSGTSITLTAIEIYVETSDDEPMAYFIDGGIGQKRASILLTSDRTRTYSYEAFFYGY